MTPRFHAKALELIGVEPRESPRAAEALAAAETRLGRVLPASLREWYSLEGACDILLRYSNEDPPVAVEDWDASPVVSRGLLPVRCENQGVCQWAAWLNGSDDPPVLVDDDDDFRHPKPYAATFSEYVYAWLWDWALVLNDATIQSQNPTFSSDALAFLRGNFEAGPVTEGWPGDAQYRFFNEEHRVLIWAAEGQADWWLAAINEDAMGRLVQKLWAMDDLGASLWAHVPAGEVVLDRVRAGFQSKPEGQ